MVLGMTGVVLQRYLLASGRPWEQELPLFFHSALFLLGAGYAWQKDAHVRVDVFYERFSPPVRAWINLLGTVLLVWPSCAALLWFSWDYVLASWAIHEASAEYQGMPGIYLLKTGIWAFAVLVALQGVSVVLQSMREMMRR